MGWHRSLLVVGWLLSSALPSIAWADEQANSTVVPSVSTWRENVESALSQRHSLDFRAIPLREVAATLQKRTRIGVQLDVKALHDAGIDPDSPITLKVKELPLRSALRRMFIDLEMTYVVADGGVLLTTQERAENQLQTVVFDVRDLIESDGERARSLEDHSPLIDLIQSTIAPSTWADTQGGPGTVEPFDGTLVVSQTQEILDQLHHLLRALRDAKRVIAESPGKQPDPAYIEAVAEEPSRAELSRALDCTVKLNVQQKPLGKVLEELCQQVDATPLISRTSLDDAGIDLETPITIESPPLPLRLLLNQILGPLELTWLVKDQVLVVTTKERAENDLAIAVYPISDLLGPSSGPNLFGRRDRSPDMQVMVDLVQSTLAPSTWADTQGGPGTIEPCLVADVLVVSQTREVHEQLVDLLAQLRRQELKKQDAEVAAAAENASVRLVVYRLPRKASSPPPAAAGTATPAADEKKETSPSNEKPAEALKQFGGFGGGFGSGVPGTAGVNYEFAVIPEERLVELITTLIDPESWGARADVKCLAAPGVLIVQHTEEVHRNVRALLQELGVTVAPPNSELPWHATWGGGFGFSGGF